MLQLLHAVQALFCAVVQLRDMNCDPPHVRHAPHVMFDVSVQAAVWYDTPAVHVPHGLHTWLLVEVGAAVWNVTPAVHSVTFEHTRSDVVVAGVLSYCMVL